MIEDAPASQKMGPFHKAVLAVWAVICLWLVGALLIGVINQLFFGDGPLDAPAPAAATSPDLPSSAGDP